MAANFPFRGVPPGMPPVVPPGVPPMVPPGVPPVAPPPAPVPDYMSEEKLQEKGVLSLNFAVFFKSNTCNMSTV